MLIRMLFSLLIFAAAASPTCKEVSDYDYLAEWQVGGPGFPDSLHHPPYQTFGYIYAYIEHLEETIGFGLDWNGSWVYPVCEDTVQWWIHFDITDAEGASAIFFNQTIAIPEGNWSQSLGNFIYDGKSYEMSLLTTDMNLAEYDELGPEVIKVNGTFWLTIETGLAVPFTVKSKNFPLETEAIKFEDRTLTFRSASGDEYNFTDGPEDGSLLGDWSCGDDICTISPNEIRSSNESSAWYPMEILEFTYCQYYLYELTSARNQLTMACPPKPCTSCVGDNVLACIGGFCVCKESYSGDNCEITAAPTTQQPTTSPTLNPTRRPTTLKPTLPPTYHPSHSPTFDLSPPEDTGLSLPVMIGLALGGFAFWGCVIFAAYWCCCKKKTGYSKTAEGDQIPLQ